MLPRHRREQVGWPTRRSHLLNLRGPLGVFSLHRISSHLQADDTVEGSLWCVHFCPLLRHGRHRRNSLHPSPRPSVQTNRPENLRRSIRILGQIPWCSAIVFATVIRIFHLDLAAEVYVDHKYGLHRDESDTA